MAAGNRQVTASTVFTPVEEGQPTDSYMWFVRGTGNSHATQLNPTRIGAGHYRVQYLGDLDPLHVSITARAQFGNATAGGDRSAFAVLTRNTPSTFIVQIDIYITVTSTGAAVDDPDFVEVSISRLPE